MTAVAARLAAAVDPTAAAGDGSPPRANWLHLPGRPRPPLPVAAARPRDDKCHLMSPLSRKWHERKQKNGMGAWSLPASPPLPPPRPVSMDTPAAVGANVGRASASATIDTPGERVDMSQADGDGCCTNSGGCLVNWTAAVRAMGGSPDGALDAGMPPIF